MKLFNSQNCQRRKYKTVWLNIDDKSCSSVSFWYDDHDNHDSIQVTPKDFVKAKIHKVNFAFAGGINEANYTVGITRNGTFYTFLFTLNRITVSHEIFGTHTLYDYAKAVFKDGYPVDSFQVVIDVDSNRVTNISTTTAKDKGYNAYLDAESSSDDTTAPVTLYPPVIQIVNGSSYTSKAMTPALAINMQTRLNYGDAPGYVIRRNIDDIGGPSYIPVVAWFIQFQPDYLMLYVVYAGAQNAFTFDSIDPRPSQFTCYQWYSDESGIASENVRDAYQNTIAFD